MKKAIRLLLITGQRAKELDVLLREADRPLEITFQSDLLGGMDKLRSHTFGVVVFDISTPGVQRASQVIELLDAAQDTPVILLGNEAANRGVGLQLELAGRSRAYVARRSDGDSLKQVVSLAVDDGKEDAAKARNEQADRELLVSHLSHECRNSLACIHQFGHILNDGLAGELTSEQRDYVAIMLDNASRIRDVIDDLLEPGSHEDKLAKVSKSCF